MTIRWRLLVGFAIVLALGVGATLLILTRFEHQLEQSLGQGSVTLAQELVDTLDRAVYHHIETLSDFLQTSSEVATMLATSNQEFADLGTVPAIAAEIERRDVEWVTTPAFRYTPLIAMVRDHPVAVQLRQKQAFYRQRYGHEVFGEIFVTNRYGATVAATVRTSDYRQDDEDWWKQARDHGFYVGEVTFDQSAELLALEVAVAIEGASGNQHGVGKAVLSVEEAREIASRFREGNEYETIVHLYDRQGNELLALGAEEGAAPLVVPATAWNQGRAVTRIRDARGNVRLLATAQSRGIKEFPGTGWRVAVEIPSEDVLEPLTNLRQTMVVVLLLAFAVAVVVALVTAASISRPIERMVETADRLSQGDLGVDFEEIGSGEVRQLFGAMHIMLANVRDALLRMIHTSRDLKGLSARLVEIAGELSGGATEQSQATQETSAAMEQMAASTRQVAANSQRVAATLEEASAGVEEMAQAVHSVAARAEQLSGGVEQTLATVREMVASIEAVASSAARAQEASQSAVSEASGGSQAVQETIESMQRIAESMNDVVEVVRRLDERSQRITQITATIEQIAKQSHLLALNATVQAAHAGEHGRGFATVAEEVGRLAERSAVATKDIGDTLADVQEEVRRALQVSRSGSSRVSDGLDTVRKAGEVLANLSIVTEELSSMMLQVRAATEEQAGATTQMATTFEHMRHLTTEVSNAAQEQATSSERISRSLDTMHAMAVEVSTAASQQSLGTEQIAQAITEIAAIATRNADNAGQIAASSEELERESSELSQVSTFFAVEDAQLRQQIDGDGHNGDGEGGEDATVTH